MQPEAALAGVLSARLLDEFYTWQAKPGSRQDDITLVVIDIL